MLYGLGWTPAVIDAATMREIVAAVDAYAWAQEQPGSNAWLLAHWLNAQGSPVPWTARTILGRPEHG